MEILLLLAGAAISWVIAHFYYKRSSKEAPEWAKPLIDQLEGATRRADELGLVATAAQSAAVPEFSFQLVAEEDPSLALAGVRIEIEKRLVQLARTKGTQPSKGGIGRLLRELGERGLLNQQERAVLADMVGLLNRAAHGETVDDRLAEWALDTGRRVIVALDHKIAVQHRKP
jgi:hypothetical protein